MPAVVAGWYSGEAAGDVIAAILFGDANPSGKLTLTFPVSDQQGAVATRQEFPGIDGKVVYAEDLRVGYRDYDAAHRTPLFPFGFGLSYTSFKIDNVKVALAAPDRIAIDGDLSNVGTRRGAEVVQTYVGFAGGSGEPPWQLKAFDRIELDPGEQRAFHVDLDRRALSTWDTVSRQWRLVSGPVKVRVGNSSRDRGAVASVSIG